MTNHPQVIITEALRYGWVRETKHSWVDLKIDEENTLRLMFADEFPPSLKLCLQQLQAHVAEERKKAGLLVLEHTYIGAVERLEYGRDDINQIVIIRTLFQNGASQDTPIGKAQIQETIEYLESALRAFENPSKPPEH